MNEDDRDRLLAELIQNPNPEERRGILQNAELDEREREDIAALVRSIKE
jgi:hypothetical protein